LSEAGSTNRGRQGRWFTLTLVALVVGCLGLAIAFNAIRRVAPLVELPPPDPNGYDDLIRAGRSIVGETPGPKGDYQTAGEAELREWVEANRKALAVARLGLERECRVVVPSSQKELQAHLDMTGDLRQLCRLMGAAARLAEIDGQRPEAVRNGLDVIKVAQRGSRGGLLVDAMTGFACESIGQRTLARLRDQLTAEECRSLVTALEAIHEQREPISAVVQRDRAWYSASLGFYYRTVLSLSGAAAKLLKPPIAAFELSSHRTVARLRLLIAELAIRRYRLENDTDPPSLEALVPRYLALVPADPYSGRAIRYRVEPPDVHRLYCVGPDGRDDDGKPLPEQPDWRNVSGDVLVDPGEPIVAPKPPSSEPRASSPATP
jgi:hypothetical protein